MASHDQDHIFLAPRPCIAFKASCKTLQDGQAGTLTSQDPKPAGSNAWQRGGVPAGFATPEVPWHMPRQPCTAPAGHLSNRQGPSACRPKRHTGPRSAVPFGFCQPLCADSMLAEKVSQAEQSFRNLLLLSCACILYPILTIDEKVQSTYTIPNLSIAVIFVLSHMFIIMIGDNILHCVSAVTTVVIALFAKTTCSINR